MRKRPDPGKNKAILKHALLQQDLNELYSLRLRLRWDKLGWSTLNMREKVINQVRAMPRYEGLTRG